MFTEKSATLAGISLLPITSWVALAKLDATLNAFIALALTSYVIPSSASFNSNNIDDPTVFALPKEVNSVSVAVFLYSTSTSFVVPKPDVTLINNIVDTTPE